jgi:hypothetical protein
VRKARGPAAVGFDAARRLRGACAVDIARKNACAAGGQAQASLTADAARCTGDEDDFVFQLPGEFSCSCGFSGLQATRLSEIVCGWV